MNEVTANVRVRGIVQGVGFRPFLHRLMKEYSLSGWIRNTPEGVEIEAEGDEAAIDAFAAAIRSDAPSLASVEGISIHKTGARKGYRGIAILPSAGGRRRDTLISPDIATCADCLRELSDPHDRRYGYPFINCTNCGPRFSIIRDIPYDRPNTAMADFDMCPECAAEYGDIADRRYHAQPDCCPVCGPELFFLDGDGNEIQGNPEKLAAELLAQGKIIAVKGLGGIHLACRCDDGAAVLELRKRKRRDEKPFAVMCRDVETARRYCEISPEEEKTLTGSSRPILLLKKRDPASLAYLSENRELGVMLPYTPLHHLLMRSGPEALVMTSGNLSDLPILTDNGEAVKMLMGVADGFLLNNREIVNRCDDSLLRVRNGKKYFIRRSRGYAPLPIVMKGAAGNVLACGAEQKASFCLSRGEQVFLSAHIGDLKNAETLRHYESQIALFERLFDIRPERIVCDLHPDYLSTDYAGRRAEKEGIALLTVQHHHAHMAACMADNGLEGQCIGVVWDGTGFGTDGTIWGGEFLTGGYEGFDRAGSIRPIRLPGGDRAVREIWRVGVSLMKDAGIDPAGIFPEKEARIIEQVLLADLNCPKSSGMGRLFDGVSAIAGICRSAGYEGQGAVLLEAAADENCGETYPYEIVRDDEKYLFDFRKMIARICEDVASGSEKGAIAARFMNALAAMAVEMCMLIRRDTGLNRVVLSGGVFQNMYILDRLTAGLEKAAFEVYCHSQVSTNDEGISFGQMAIAEKGGGTDVPCGAAENC